MPPDAQPRPVAGPARGCANGRPVVIDLEGLGTAGVRTLGGGATRLEWDR
jgi:hypothetical protein